MPISSFSGHFAGIVAGYIIGWGVLDGVRGYWLWTSLIYIVVIILLSLSMNLSLPRWAREYVVVSPELSQATTIEGVSSSETRDAATVESPRMILDANGNLSQYRSIDRSQIV